MSTTEEKDIDLEKVFEGFKDRFADEDNFFIFIENMDTILKSIDEISIIYKDLIINDENESMSVLANNIPDFLKEKIISEYFDGFKENLLPDFPMPNDIVDMVNASYKIMFLELYQKNFVETAIVPFLEGLADLIKKEIEVSKEEMDNMDETENSEKEEDQ